MKFLGTRKIKTQLTSTLWVVNYFFNPLSFVVKAYKNPCQHNFNNSTVPDINLRLTYPLGCIHNHNTDLSDHFCDQEEMLDLFEIYKIITDDLPWKEEFDEKVLTERLRNAEGGFKWSEEVKSEHK